MALKGHLGIFVFRLLLIVRDFVFCAEKFTSHLAAHFSSGLDHN